MTIVPIGNLPLQVPENGSDEFVFKLVEHMRDLILHLAARCLEASLKTEMERFLGQRLQELFSLERLLSLLARPFASISGSALPINGVGEWLRGLAGSDERNGGRTLSLALTINAPPAGVVYRSYYRCNGKSKG